MALCRLVTAWSLALYHGRSGLTTMKMANNQSVFWKWNTSLLECDNACCAVHSFVVDIQEIRYLSKSWYSAECPTGESPPVGGEYPASEGLAVCTE